MFRPRLTIVVLVVASLLVVVLIVASLVVPVSVVASLVVLAVEIPAGTGLAVVPVFVSHAATSPPNSQIHIFILTMQKL